MNTIILGNIIALIAASLSIVIGIIKSKKKVLYTQTIQYIAYATADFILGGITGAIYRTITYSGVQILVFLAAIQSVPGHLYEAAKIEGATSYESFWKITLPMVSPQIITVVVYTIVDSFLRSGINDVIDYQYTQAFFGKHAAMSWIYVLASVLILAIAVGILNKVVFYQDDKK